MSDLSKAQKELLDEIQQSADHDGRCLLPDSVVNKATLDALERRGIVVYYEIPEIHEGERVSFQFVDGKRTRIVEPMRKEKEFEIFLEPIAEEEEVDDEEEEE